MMGNGRFALEGRMKFEQTQLRVRTEPNKAMLITREIEVACPFIQSFEKGILQVFLRHTSASLSINENSDPDVRSDLMMAIDRLAPESLPYRHRDEGPDDMPSHVKSSLLGASVSIPIQNGKLALGRWQGIYLCEHRAHSHERELICTAFGIG